MKRQGVQREKSLEELLEEMMSDEEQDLANIHTTIPSITGTTAEARRRHLALQLEAQRLQQQTLAQSKKSPAGGSMIIKTSREHRVTGGTRDSFKNLVNSLLQSRTDGRSAAKVLSSKSCNGGKATTSSSKTIKQSTSSSSRGTYNKF